MGKRKICVPPHTNKPLHGYNRYGIPLFSTPPGPASSGSLWMGFDSLPPSWPTSSWLSYSMTIGTYSSTTGLRAKLPFPPSPSYPSLQLSLFWFISGSLSSCSPTPPTSITRDLRQGLPSLSHVSLKCSHVTQQRIPRILVSVLVPRHLPSTAQHPKVHVDVGLVHGQASTSPPDVLLPSPTTTTSVLRHTEYTVTATDARTSSAATMW